MMKFSKKGQLTVFIIIGIVLLFSTALGLYVKKSVSSYSTPVDVALEQVPQEIKPIQTYVSNCVELTAKEAIRKIGVQGGYLDASGLVVNDAQPSTAEAISMSPGSEVKVPYWYYMKSPNDCETGCEFNTKQLPLFRTAGTGNSIEEQIDKYVKEKLSSCLANFIPFKQQFEVKQGDVNVVTTVAKTNVFIQVTTPITVTASRREDTLSRFTVSLPINLGKFYDLATEITRKQENTRFIDHLTVNLIDSFSGLSKDKLPPLADVTLGGEGAKYWLLKEVRSKIEEMLMIYIPALQATGTSNYKGNLYQGDNLFNKGLYSLFILPLNNTRAASAEFTYLAWWPSYVKVTPASGEMIKPEATGGFLEMLSSFIVTQYKFAYAVSYPVLVTLTDPTAFNGEGFTFQFALESNLRNNVPMTSATSLLSTSDRVQSFLCDPDNQKSGDVAVKVTDSFTKGAIDDAVVYFSFGKEACLIGNTEIINGTGLLTSKFPVGVGAIVVSKPGYLSKTIPFATQLRNNKSIDVELEPFAELKVSVMRVPVTKNIKSETNTEGIKKVLTGGKLITDNVKQEDVVKTIDDWSLGKPIPNLLATQQIIVSLSRIKESPAQQDYVAAFEMKGNSSEIKKITLAPGNYSVFGSLFDNRKIIIPKDEICYDKEWYQSFVPDNVPGGQTCDTIPEIAFETFPQGGVSLSSFTVTSEDLKTAKELVIYLFSAPDGFTRESNGMTDMKHKDLEQAGKIEQYSKDYPTKVMPVFK